MSEITSAELQRWADEFDRQNRTGRVTLLDPLPWRARLRFWVTSRIDGLAIWLIKHGHPQAGKLVWRAYGRW